MAKLAVLDPSGLYRAGLASLLQALGFGDLVEGADIDELSHRVRDGAEPDIVLVNLPRNTRPIEALMRDVAEAFGHTRVVFLADTLGKSLTLVASGGKVFPPELASFIPALAARPSEAEETPYLARDSRLSGRELEILQCLTRGQSNKAIGHALDIAEATVKVHVKRILRKIHASNRTQAALWAVSRGIGTIADANERALIDRQPAAAGQFN